MFVCVPPIEINPPMNGRGRERIDVIARSLVNKPTLEKVQEHLHNEQAADQVTKMQISINPKQTVA